MFIEFKKLSDLAKIPTKAHELDAAFDLYSAESLWIKPGERVAIKTDMAISIPKGYFGKIYGRSGLARKFGLDTLGGVIDSGYLGNIIVMLINLSNGNEEESFHINIGDKIAQIAFHEVPLIKFIEVREFESTERAEKGFGSSDK